MNGKDTYMEKEKFQTFYTRIIHEGVILQHAGKNDESCWLGTFKLNFDKSMTHNIQYPEI